jgi:hypothetical protein
MLEDLSFFQTTSIPQRKKGWCCANKHINCAAGGAAGGAAGAAGASGGNGE